MRLTGECSGWGGVEGFAGGRQRTAVNPSSLQVLMKPAAASATVDNCCPGSCLLRGGRDMQLISAMYYEPDNSQKELVKSAGVTTDSGVDM